MVTLAGTSLSPMLAAHSQVLSRRVNERILELAPRATTAHGLFVCECGQAECSEPLDVTPAEVEDVRADGSHFVVVPGHEQLRLETVLTRTGRYVVVDKNGSGRTLALRTDPRRRARVDPGSDG